MILTLVTLAGSALWYQGVTKLEYDALQINLAGRQRMLVEQIGTFSTLLAHATDPAKKQPLREQMSETIQQLERSRSTLLNEFGKLSEPLLALYFDEPNAANSWLSDYTTRLKVLLSLPDSASIEDDRNFQFIQNNLISTIERLDRVVAQYQLENEQALRHSITFNILITGITLLILLATALFIFRPMEKRIVRDHTRELQIANDALRVSQEELQLHYDNAPDMLLSLDIQTQRIVRCNATTAAKLGYSKDEILCMSRNDLYAPACRERAADAFREFLATGRIEDVELQVVCKDGKVIDVSLSATQYQGAGRKFLHSDAILRDITARKQAEAKIIKRDRQLTTLYLMGEQMLLSKDLSALMHNVAYCLFETLSVNRVLVCKLCPGGRSLVVQAAIGIPRSCIRADPYFIARNSLPERALISDQTLYLSGQKDSGWLDGMDYLGKGTPGCGVASLLRDAEGVFGLLMAYHKGANDFSQEDIDYIQSLAHLLSVATDRIRLKREHKNLWGNPL